MASPREITYLDICWDASSSISVRGVGSTAK
jgi:hypothetical protein